MAHVKRSNFQIRCWISSNTYFLFKGVVAMPKFVLILSKLEQDSKVTLAYFCNCPQRITNLRHDTAKIEENITKVQV